MTVDRGNTQLSGGGEVTPDHRELKPNGQQKGYIVLTPEERAKGFVRPVRDVYIHVGKRPTHATRELTKDEHERYDQYGYLLYEEYPDGSPHGLGKFWIREELESGCNSETWMARDLAETYARDPKFYGGTFCAVCRKHRPLDEFVWKGTAEQVGS